MKFLIPFVALGVLLVAGATANAQCPVVTYYSPAPMVAAAPVVAAPYVVARPVVYTSYYTPYTTYYAPTAYAPAAPVSYSAYYAPAVVGRPVVTYWSPYGGPEVRVPGQPVRNFFRAVIP